MNRIAQRPARIALSTALAFALVACGGGGSSSPPPIVDRPGPTPTPTPPTATCALSNQIDFAEDVLNEWYVFPSLLDNSIDPRNFASVQSYLDARVAPARAAGRDDGFTFATSIAEEDALIDSGSTAGFGIRLSFDDTNRRLFLLEAFESGPGFAAGLDRGSEILAIGINSSNLQTVSALFQQGGREAIIDALGPGDPGVSRIIRFAQSDGRVIERSITKTEFAIDPVSDRYGATIHRRGARTIGYLNYRTFLPRTGVEELRDAFALFRTQGVTDLVVDFRYNSGGLVTNANLLGSLLGRGLAGEVFSETRFNPAQSNRNQTVLFEPEANALRPDRIAFITTNSSASASELVINSLLPYYDDADIALIGENTSGKPVGQSAFDLSACDLRIRALTFQTFNADGFGDYFGGLADFVPNTCRARDDISAALGDPNENSISVALDFIEGRSCTPIAGSSNQRVQGTGGREMLRPEQRSAAQHELPGLF
ncbi:MAG: S41 family peptidase [Erythrobacter sp.]|nr:S41 family peptidase [Erythrobacter sp.]